MPRQVAELKGPVTFEFTPPGSNRSYLAAAEPVRLEPESEALGAIIVAKPRTELRDQWLPLVLRLAAAVGVGALLAGLLSWWLSRKITGPVLGALERRRRDRGGELRRPRSGRRRRRRDQPPVGAVQRDGGAPRGDRGA